MRRGMVSFVAGMGLLALAVGLFLGAPTDWRTAVLLFLFGGLAMGHALRERPPDGPPPAAQVAPGPRQPGNWARAALVRNAQE